MSSPQDRVMVVTGTSSGIGAAVADLLRSSGTHVVGLDAHPARGGRAFDVRDPSAWSALAAELSGPDHPPVHGLVNCAGITRQARLGDVTSSAFTAVYEVNVLGPLLGIQAITPLMPPGGSIVNVGSLAGLQGHPPVAYTSSKWALRGLTHAACLELGPRGIRVNIVHPGFVETPMTTGADPALRAASLAATPLGRVGSAYDVASVVTFLLSDQAAFVSGAEIPVDGGVASHGGAKAVSDALLPSYRPPADQPATKP